MSTDNSSGNCGWSAKKEESGDGSIIKEYNQCYREEDKLCGLLHCQFNDYTPDQDVKILNPKLGSVSHHVINDSVCLAASFDVGLGE